MGGGENDDAQPGHRPRGPVDDRRPTRLRRRCPGVAASTSPATRRTRSTSSTSTRNGMPQVMAFVLGALVPAAARRLPLDRHPDQGDPAQPALDRRRPSALLVLVFQDGHGADLLGFKPGPDRGVRAGLHLHDPVRALDGLPRLHPHPDQGGPRPRAVVERGRRPGDLDHGRHDHERGRDHGRRVQRVRDARADGHQAARVRARGRGLPRRDDRPERPAAGDDAAPRRVELVAAAVPVAGCPQVTIEGELPETDDEPVAAPPAMPVLEGGR